jgi:hypothetical protein
MTNFRQHVAAAVLVAVLAAAMAPGLPILRSTFFAGGDIGPALPTNLLRMDGLKRTWGNLLLPVLLEAPGRFCCFLVLLEALFGRQFSWWKVTFFCLPFFWFLLVDCYMVHFPSFASFA